MNELHKKATIPQGVMVDKRLLNVIEVKETIDINLVNNLIRDGWILIRVIPKDKKILFCLGRIKSDISK